MHDYKWMLIVLLLLHFVFVLIHMWHMVTWEILSFPIVLCIIETFSLWLGGAQSLRIFWELDQGLALRLNSTTPWCKTRTMRLTNTLYAVRRNRWQPMAQYWFLSCARTECTKHKFFQKIIVLTFLYKDLYLYLLARLWNTVQGTEAFCTETGVHTRARDVKL